MTGPEMLMRALLPKGFDPQQLMHDAQHKIGEVVALCQLAEQRLAAIEAACHRIEQGLLPAVQPVAASMLITHAGE